MLDDRPLEPGAAGRLAILTGEMCGIRGEMMQLHADLAGLKLEAPGLAACTQVAGEAIRSRLSTLTASIENIATDQARQAEQQAHFVNVLANLLEGVQAVYSMLTTPPEIPASDALMDPDVQGAEEEGEVQVAPHRSVETKPTAMQKVTTDPEQAAQPPIPPPRRLLTDAGFVTDERHETER